MTGSLRPACLILSAFSIALAFPFDGSDTLTSQGVDRTFLYHAPGDSIVEGLPLVIVFHDRNATAEMIKGYSGFDALAAQHGFIVVYPNATNIGGARQWNVYVDDVAGHGGIDDFDATDDVIFLDDLIEHFCTTYGIDPRRIYATGHSNGGYMAYALAVKRPQIIAAIAPFGGSLWGDMQYLTNHFGQQYVKLGVMHMHGDADITVPYPDPTHTSTAYIWPLSSFATGNCNAFEYEVVEVNDLVHRLVYCNGAEPDTQRVELVRLLGHGQAWPTMPNQDAAERIWDFLALHQKYQPMFTCVTTDIRELEPPVPPLSIYPNPTTGIIRFDRLEGPCSLRIYDLRGSLLAELQPLHDVIDVGHLPAGMLLLEAVDKDGIVRRARFIKE